MDRYRSIWIGFCIRQFESTYNCEHNFSIYYATSMDALSESVDWIHSILTHTRAARENEGMYIMRQWHEHCTRIPSRIILYMRHIIQQAHILTEHTIEIYSIPYSRRSDGKKMCIYLIVDICVYQSFCERNIRCVSHHQPPLSFHPFCVYPIRCDLRIEEVCQKAETEIATDKQTDMHGMVCVLLRLLWKQRQNKERKTTTAIAAAASLCSWAHLSNRYIFTHTHMEYFIARR